MNKCVATGNKITRRDGSKYIVIVKGDVNGDGIIDIQDMITINNYRLYNTENNLEEVYKLAADVNDDKEIDIQDMIVINNYRLYLTSFQEVLMKVKLKLYKKNYLIVKNILNYFNKNMKLYFKKIK